MPMIHKIEMIIWCISSADIGESNGIVGLSAFDYLYTSTHDRDVSSQAREG